jgi:dienelactone hydrolase
VAGACFLVLAWLPGGARAAPPLGLESCREREGVHQCSGIVESWDGVPLDTTLTLPAAGARGLPLVVAIHGLGNSKHEYLDPASTAYTDNVYAWAKDGYAVLSYTARGFWGSCGTPESRAARPDACAKGYIHLADARFEVRDSQELIGRLVDEGTADPRRIGVTGDSYGGGQTMMLAALNDRVMLPDGRLVAWRSRGGTPLRIAGAAPVIPWTDLVYAVAPNGSTLTYSIPPPGAAGAPVGVPKISISNGILAATEFAVGPGQPVGEPFVPGRPMGYLAPPGVDPQADVKTWVARTNAGPPYTDPLARSIVETITRFHSAYGIDPSHAPAPLFIGSGFTDDIFPVDEVTRFANRTRRLHPQVPLSLLLGDFGHMRALNKAADRRRLLGAVHAWLDHHVRGDGPDPATGVTATTQSCPRERPSDGPFSAPTFTALSRGEVRFTSDTPRTVLAGGGDPAIGAAIDPAAGGGDGCARTAAGDQSGTATYRLPPAREGGFTLLGAPTVLAELDPGADRESAQLALRLWDVAPGGSSQTLVARGSYRPSGRGREVFQLHPNGYRFESGHVAKLEVLGSDPPYGRPSNDPSDVRIERLELRLPVREGPDCRTVLPAAAPVLPAGHELAPGVSTAAAPGCEGGAATDPGQADAPAGRGPAERRRARVDEAAGPGPSPAGEEPAGALPFTGLGLPLIAAVGILLIALGWLLLRRLRATIARGPC